MTKKYNHKPRPLTEYVIVHCSATYKDMDIGREEINDWHIKKGWSGIGYHYVIRRSGFIESGREHNVIGAHCRGENYHSVGVCLIGGVAKNPGSEDTPENNFTKAQFKALDWLIDYLDTLYPDCEVRGHRYFNPNKACPSFNVVEWMDNKMHRDEGKVDILEIIYLEMKKYPEGCEVHTVLKKILNDAGKAI